jgi:hypothetical protein
MNAAPTDDQLADPHWMNKMELQTLLFAAKRAVAVEGLRLRV